MQIFLLNTEEHPASSNAFDSLAEAFQAIGDKAAARKYYELALQKDPQTFMHGACLTSSRTESGSRKLESRIPVDA